MHTLISLIIFFICINAWSSDPPLTLYDEGVKQGVVFKIDCVGAGVACTKSGITGTATISGNASGWTDGGANVYTTTTTDNVGIGTISPISLFEVKGSATFSGTGNTNFTTNVGISSVNPTQALDVSGTVKATAFSGDGSALTGIGSGGGWTDGGTNIFNSTFTDNVGIGTSNPTSQLLIYKSGADTKIAMNSLSTVGAGPDCDSSTKLLLHYDSDLTTDSNCSSTSNTINGAGNAAVSSTQKAFGAKSMVLDGTGDYDIVTNASWMNIATGDWTINFWFYKSGNTNSIMGRLHTDPPYEGWYLTFEGASNLEFYNNNNTLRITCSSSQSNSTSAFYSLTQNGGTITMYKDGTSCGTWAGHPQDYSANLIIGGNGLNSANGYIDEVRFDVGVDRYGGNYSVETAAFGASVTTYYNPYIQFQSDSSGKFNLGADNTDSYKLKISNGTTLTSSAPYLTITSAGNVGIGTLNPVNVLEVVGTTKATTFSGAGTSLTGTAASLTAGNVTTNANLTGDVTSVGNATTLSTTYTGWTDGGANVFTTTSTDNVGIGTLNPRLKLEITGNIGTLFRSINTASSGSAAGAGLIGGSDDGAALASGDRLGFLAFAGSEDSIHTIGNGAAITAFAAGTFTTSSIPTDLRFETAPSGSTTRTANLYVMSTGNVGIGTAIPVQKLQIGGSGSLIRMFDSNGVGWNCGPAITTGAFTCS